VTLNVLIDHTQNIVCDLLSQIGLIIEVFKLFLGTETRLTESLSLIDAVTPDIVAARQNAHNAQKQAIKAEPGSGGEQNGVDVCYYI
jgi:hypothetical protein